MQVRQFMESMYPGQKVEVCGKRPPMRGGKKPLYTAFLIIDDKVVATAQERNWRMAYKTLQINASKGMYA